MFKRFFIPFLAVLAGWTVTQAQEQLTVVLDADPPRLDPFYSTAWVEEQVLHNVFDKLFEVDEDLNITPGLVTEYSVSDDGLVYTFELRDGVVFHDGTTLDAEAVKFNLDAILDASDESPRYTEINVIEEVEVVDDLQFTITVSEPATPLIGALANRAGMIASPAQIEELGRADFHTHPIGSGPFMYVDRAHGDRIELAKNPDYWQDDLPVVDSVIYQVIADQNVAVLNLQQGQVDILQARSIADQIMPTLEADPNVVLDVQPGIGWQGLWLNTESAPFDNVDLRRALDAAVDRAAIAQVAYVGAAEPAWGPFSPRSPHYDGLIQERDAELVRELLAEAGHPDGFSFTLTIGTGGTYETIGEMLQNMLGEFGIQVNLNVLEYGQVLDDLYESDFEATLVGWNGRVDPDGDIYSFHYTGGANNYSGYSNSELDALLDESRRLPNGDERAAVIQEALDVVRADAPYIFLVHPSQRHAYRSDLTDMTVHPDGMVRLLNVGRD